ncbi:MAG: VacJ family lipoprotein [Bermanella sp.]
MRLITPTLTFIFISLLSFQSMANQQDPWEDWNRDVFAFNETLDYYTLKPVAQAYRNVTPQVVDDAISNVFSNLGEPVVIVSDLAQGKFLDALADTGRFLINSTIGVLGVFDVARHMGLEKHNEDLGQALAFWGVASGPYLMLPILGPSTVRDAAGFSVENLALSDINVGSQVFTSDELFYAMVYGKYLDIRGDLIPTEGLISGDRYAFIRSFYLQRRDYLVNDGEVADEFSDEFEDEFEDDF